MRRGLASLIMGLSLLVATFSWSGFIMSRTVLDPGRSERLADTLLDNTEVRAVIVDRLADAVEVQIPAEVPVTRETIETAADAALDDPRVEELIRDGFVEAHQNALNGVDEPVMIDAGALGAAGRDAVVELQPDLDAVLPAAPEVEVELPNTGLSWLGTVKRYVDRFTLIGAVLAVIGVTTAFVIARNRAAALRRMAFWAFGAAAFWLIVAYALPWLLGRIAPGSVSIATAAIDVFFEAMIRPATGLAVVGVGLLLLSFVWPSIERRRGSSLVDGGRPQRSSGAAPSQRAAAPASLANQPPVRSPRPAPAAAGPELAATYEEAVAHRRQPPPQRQPQPRSQPQDATAQFPQVISNVGRNPEPVAADRPAHPPAVFAEAARPVEAPPDPYRPDHQVSSQQPPTVFSEARTDPYRPDHQVSGQQPPTVFSEPVGSGAPRQDAQPPSVLGHLADADEAADGDDFGADWVEGRGYVEGGEPGRR